MLELTKKEGKALVGILHTEIIETEDLVNNENQSKLICGCCGSFYGVKLWHSNSAYRKEILQCTKKYSKGKDKCSTPNLTEEIVKSKFVEAYNKLMVDKALLIENTKSIIELLTDTSKIDATIQKLNEELNDVRILVENLIKDNASRAQNQTEYTNRYNALNEKYNLTKGKIEEALIKRNEMQQNADSLKCFLKELTDKPSLIETYDSILWNSMLDEAIVNEDGTIQFKFKGGKEITL